MGLKEIIRQEVERILIEGIEDDTPILPYVVADRVVYEEGDDADYYIDRLVEIAEDLYDRNPSFRKRINGRGNSGRDYLYTMMDHWYKGYKKTGTWIDEKETVQESKQLNEVANMDVVEMFFDDSFPKDKRPVWGSKNIKIAKQPNGWAIKNYSTPILYRKNGSDTIYFNTDNYSATTRKIQTQIRRLADLMDIDLVETDERGIEDQIYDY